MQFSKEITNDILDSVSEGIFTVDKSFRINFFNSAAEKILGYKREEIVGKFCKYVFKSNVCNTACPIASVLESGKDIGGQETRLKHQNGHTVSIRLNAAVLRSADESPIGGVISFRDVTEIEKMKNLLSSSGDYFGVVGHSKEMQKIFDLIDEISDSDAAVLIQGPSGTGKEMIANAIQQSSKRKDRPFVKINCSVFSPQLLASELFGHVRGAFTGASRDRPGRFELAHNGTIFLDEVAEMPLQMQVQLLRILQEGTFERVGESVTRKVNIRVMAATNIDLEKALGEGKFREDLYYRLNVIPVKIPALRDRLEDIPYLVRHFIDKYSNINRKEINDIEDEALDVLLSYDWPGNVRELENAIEYAFARTAKDSVIQTCKLPANIRQNHTCGKNGPSPTAVGGELTLIMDLLEKHRWNKTKVAKELGVGRTTLWRKLQQYGIEEK